MSIDTESLVCECGHMKGSHNGTGCAPIGKCGCKQFRLQAQINQEQGTHAAQFLSTLEDSPDAPTYSLTRAELVMILALYKQSLELPPVKPLKGTRCTCGHPRSEHNMRIGCTIPKCECIITRFENLKDQ